MLPEFTRVLKEMQLKSPKCSLPVNLGQSTAQQRESPRSRCRRALASSHSLALLSPANYDELRCLDEGICSPCESPNSLDWESEIQTCPVMGKGEVPVPVVSRSSSFNTLSMRRVVSSILDEESEGRDLSSSPTAHWPTSPLRGSAFSQLFNSPAFAAAHPPSPRCKRASGRECESSFASIPERS